VTAGQTVSVVVPVKDGRRFLAEVLDAVLAQSDSVASLEVLVIDSGSTDGSVAVALERDARVLEIEPAAFGHGRTRNLGMEATAGEVVCFLTQDATPVAGWLSALTRGFSLAADVGAVYGPHLAREDTPPMIARELAAFFATHEGPDGGPCVQREGDQAFLSNVNAAYRRDCWEVIRFPDVPYSEDQAFARAMLAQGWAKAYVPEAAVLHAHDYPPLQFMRRYYDEYRGLRTTLGHVEPFGLRTTVRDVRSLVAADRRWLREHGGSPHAWTARSLTHHTGRKVFSALGSRAHAMPPAVQRRLSLEGTVAPAASATTTIGPPVGKAIPGASRPIVWDAVRRYAKEGPAPLLPPLSGDESSAPLHIACVIPPFSRGSGGHNSILQIMSRLERKGHVVTYWIDDQFGSMAGDRAARIRRDMREWFAPVEGPGLQGLRRLVRRRRSRRNGLADRPSGDAASRLPRSRLPRARPRNGVLRDVGRVALRRVHLRARHARDLRVALARGNSS
jgi:glycosyltransferase involved in cell wall biosynthesis